MTSLSKTILRQVSRPVPLKLIRNNWGAGVLAMRVMARRGIL
jgi:hypothetical protein